MCVCISCVEKFIEEGWHATHTETETETETETATETNTQVQSPQNTKTCEKWALVLSAVFS